MLNQEFFNAGCEKVVCVLGLGYIGLPLASLVADSGAKVVGVDLDQAKVDSINAGYCYINEPGLSQLVSAAVQNGRLSAVTTPVEADVYIIAVPTPYDEMADSADLRYVVNAITAIAPHLRAGALIINESTCPPGTMNDMTELLRGLCPSITFPDRPESRGQVGIASCPERILPGNALAELRANDRIIGGLSRDCTRKAKEFYGQFVHGELLSASTPSIAELAKLAENCFRDLNIAFANELSLIADKLDCDVREVIRLANRHPRVNILNPGIGVGGHCIAVDPKFLIEKSVNESQLIRKAREINDSMPNIVTEKIVREVSIFRNSNEGKNLTICCHGLAFKPNVDDLRESPAIDVVTLLNERLAETLIVTEPNIDDDKSGFCNELGIVSLEAALDQADLHVLLVAHSEYETVDWQNFQVVDCCGLMNEREA